MYDAVTLKADDGTGGKKWSLWGSPPAAAAFSAILLLLAFAPTRFFLLPLAALAPWFASLMVSRGRGGARSGAVFGLVYGLGQFLFLAILTERWTGNPALAAVPWLLAAGLWTLYYSLAGWLVGCACAKGRWWLVPVVWVGAEALLSSAPVIQFPWGLLATPLAAAPELIQGASVGTVLFVSGWAALANVFVALVLVGVNPQVALRYGLTALGLALLSLVRYAMPPVAGESLVVLVAQPGVDVAFGDQNQARLKLDEAIARASATAASAGADLMVLPEGVAHAQDGSVPLSSLGARPSLPVLLGGQRRTPDGTFQSAFAFDGVRWESADKTRLVVFGEYVPGRERLPFLKAFRLAPIDLKPGAEIRVVEVAGATLGPVLCFEALFPDVVRTQARRGAQMLAVLSVDDWFFGSPAVDQLAAATVWRAVETGLPAVRAATQGTSMAVDARGNVLARAPLGVFAPMRVEFSLPERGDGFRFAWIFPAACALLSLAAAVEAVLGRPRKGSA